MVSIIHDTAPVYASRSSVLCMGPVSYFPHTLAPVNLSQAIHLCDHQPSQLGQ